MKSINKVMLVGRITDGPTSVPFSGDTATLTVETERAVRDGEGGWKNVPDRHTIKAKDWLGRSVQEHCKTGDIIAVIGELQQHVYTSEVNGKEVTRLQTEVVATQVSFIGQPVGGLRSPEPEEADEELQLEEG